jgi:pSer/pThr/pTyr-binding forkhead associated (FHA) protein
MTSVGSGPGNSIRLPDPGVAPEHARIWRTPHGTFFVENLGAGVTRVNGVEVQKEWLPAGAAIAFGSWEGKAGWWTPPAGWTADRR